MIHNAQASVRQLSKNVSGMHYLIVSSINNLKIIEQPTHLSDYSKLSIGACSCDTSLQLVVSYIRDIMKGLLVLFMIAFMTKG